MLKWELTSSAPALQKILILWGFGSLSASDALLKGLFSRERHWSLYRERSCPPLPQSQSINPAKLWLD